MSTTDILYCEKEVKEMMDHVKKIYEKLSDEKALNSDSAGLKTEERKRYQNSNMNLEDSLEQIEKMKIILEAKVEEEKKAKLCRIQSEEESRNILRSLIYDEVSNALKNNLREFMDLLHESGNINDDQEDSVREKEYEVPEKDKIKSFIKPMKFIERNIQLAQCGKGVLSLTDNEKLRIQNLLVEDEEEDCLDNDSEEFLKHSVKKNCEYFYGFDDDSKFLLKRIDEQLQGFPKQIHLNAPESSQSSTKEETEPQKDKGNVSDANDGTDSNKSKRRNQNERQNLKKIEKLLSDLNSITDKEISPLPSEEMEDLIREARQNLQDTAEKGSEKSHREDNVKELELQEKDLITDLVLNAKSLMPKFKFRFHNE